MNKAHDERKPVRQRARIAVDIAMTAGLMFLMGYMVTGDLAHEIIGTLTIVLWGVHVILNRKWYSSLFTGKYSGLRIFNTAVNILLMITAIGLVISSVLLSSYVFYFLGIGVGMGFARVLHMVTSYWFFILTALHLGLHWAGVSRMLSGKSLREPSRLRFIFSHGATLVLSGYGVYAFFKQQIGIYLFMRTQFVFFDFEQPVLSFFFEYTCMMILFAWMAYWLSAFFRGRKSAGRSR